MSNNIRIRTNPNSFENTTLKVKLDQDFDFLEILSLSISQEEVYRRFCSDYGVVVGRIIMNNGVGIPNCKVSIFVPLSDEDAEDDEIKGLYPFEAITDTDDEGKRYNLLPDSSQFDCHTVVGTLANKREILDNDLKLDIHCKYYKYTAITNAAGDFMIFGVPVGTHFINVDCDLSDIGIYSQRPYDFIANGQPKSAFENSNKFKGGEDLNKLNQIKNQQTSVNVVPFWGDADQCSVGISRLDVDLKHEIKPSAIFMGGIFSDNEKNSINKGCRPRKKLGKICESSTGPGTIEMLRKDISGQNQRFDVEGGRVIDDDGAWAYQVPMNLDYMVTNEFGDLVPTEDPSKGIPTRARVRFRAGMDVTGGEGRLRTRAKHLIPHNPESYAESDYTFDHTTGSGTNGSKHFHDMYWNKIYSVKNFIPRFQALGGLPNVGGLNPDVDIRAMMGIKDVDDCVGTHNPFPFNRMDSDVNPLFLILCIIIQIIAFIVILINNIILPIINFVIMILNAVLRVICEVVFFIGKLVCGLKHLTSSSKRKKCRKKACMGDCSGSCKSCNCKDLLPYIPCITMKCQSEEYGPGCVEGDKPMPFHVTDRPPMTHWPDDGHPFHGYSDTTPPGDAGWAFCVAISLAEALNVWEFDFYNDWVNGALYAPLLKYKKKRRGKEKFCEYDCRDFGGGVDGNDDGTGDNRCHNNWLVDSCTGSGVKTGESVQIRDGLIKSVDGELYYAAFTHTAGYKLFSTDIIELGAVFECDWQGKPKIQKLLVPTSYKTPELLDEYDDANPSIIITSGFDSPSRYIKHSLFFDVSCLGLDTNSRTCENVKRQCEIGVGLNEDRTDEQTQIGCTPPTGLGLGGWGTGSGAVGNGTDYEYPRIDNCDIDYLYVRDAFADCNNPTAGINFNSLSVANHALFGATAYNNFRDIQNNTIKQPWGDSFYFYFGLKPGKTGLDKMNNRFFEECIVTEVNDFVVACSNVVDATTTGGNDGSIDITVIGGTAPYTFNWSNGATTEDITGLAAGAYTVTVVDAEGLTANQTCTVGQPFAVNCFATPIPVTSNGASDGAISVVGIGGGTGPYTVTVTGTNPPLPPVTQTVTPPTQTAYFAGLPAGEYSVVTTDFVGSTAPCATTGVTITTPPPLVITGTSENVSCFNAIDGTITLGYVTGVAPVTFETTGGAIPVGSPITTTNISGLQPGVYTTTATDGIGQTAIITHTISLPPAITATLTPSHITCNGADDGSITASGIGGGTPPYTFEWDGPTIDPITYTGVVLQPIGPNTLPSDYPAGTYTFTVTDANGCTNDFDVEVYEPDVVVITVNYITDVTCNGGTDGVVSVSVTGGNPDLPVPNGQYQVRIDGGSWQNTATGNYVFTGLAASPSPHVIEARDTAHNCPAIPVNATVNEPTIVVVNLSSANSNSITVNGSGGNGGPYQFRINSGTWQSSGTFTGLSSSTAYNFEAQDALGCISAVQSFSTTA